MNKIYKLTSASLLLGAALLAVIFVTSPVHATNQITQNSAANFLNSGNPSGKTDARGNPLHSPLSQNLASPRHNTESAPVNIKPECPTDVKCIFTPAAYQQDDPNDPSNYGNYDVANRPFDGMKINQIVIHDTEGSTAQSAIAEFQDPLQYVSAHYIIDTDGTIYQMVQNKNVAWHAGNYYVNMHSIGIEHVGHATAGSVEYTKAMYDASAKLVKWLATKYGIPMDNQHIIGHSNVPAPTSAYVAGMHWDPGPYWNWQGYMAAVGAPMHNRSKMLDSPAVTVATVWPQSKQTVTDCVNDNCPPVPSTPQPTSFVYLRTAPNDNAPFITDPILGQGTTAANNVAAKAYFGQKFSVANVKIDLGGVWYQVWFDGQLAWFRSPFDAQTAKPDNGAYITPKTGLSSIPVYGRAYPEASAYPANFTAAPAVAPLPYTIAAGQRYTTAGLDTPTDYYYAWTINNSMPYDHTVFKGNDKYIRIQFNGREAYVRKADVYVEY